MRTGGDNIKLVIVNERVNEVIKEGENHGVPSRVIRVMIKEFEEIKGRSPENFAELVEVVLC